MTGHSPWREIKHKSKPDVGADLATLRGFVDGYYAEEADIILARVEAEIARLMEHNRSLSKRLAESQVEIGRLDDKYDDIRGEYLVMEERAEAAERALAATWSDDAIMLGVSAAVLELERGGDRRECARAFREALAAQAPPIGGVRLDD